MTDEYDRDEDLPDEDFLDDEDDLDDDETEDPRSADDFLDSERLYQLPEAQPTDWPDADPE